MKIGKTLPYLLLVLATMLWGGNFVIGRAISGQVPPLTLAFLRWVVAVVIFLPLAWQEIGANKQEIKKCWKALVLMGLTGVAGFNTLVYVGLHYTSSINASLVNTITPLIILLLSYFLLKEPLLYNQLLGLILSISGVFLILSKGSLDVLISLSFNVGDLIVFIAVLLWGVYSIIIKYNSGRIPLYSSLAIPMVIGMFTLLPFSLWELFIAGQKVIWSMPSIAAIVYVGIFASIVAFLSWNKAVSLIGPGKAGIFLSLIPLFTTIFAIAFIGETLKWYQMVGGVLAVAGIYLATRIQTASHIKDSAF
ncbi:DMT family transporter [Desulfitibacter alkalitolerans]|uniref:DMT family transporter n=1 Tax=Desulfitibacter alkalitolerans TaxID=264641 RepID=UPI000485C498|nr:DMT family transporter [Desulfitibacter alkalitolerans]